MNLLKGSFYIFFQSYKKQNVIFGSILLSIVLFSFFLAASFGDNLSLAITVSIPVYTFFSIMASKLLNRTMPYFLKLGFSRGQYIFHVGLFFIAWSVFGAFFIACIQKIIFFFSDALNFHLMILHPVYFFDTSLPFLLTFVIDTAILLLCLTSSLLSNVIFYRLGTVGGYTFIGIMIFIPILIVSFDLYQQIFEFLNDLTFIAMCGSLVFISAILYAIITAGLRKASAIPA